MEELQDVPALPFDIVDEVVFKHINEAAGPPRPLQINLR